MFSNLAQNRVVITVLDGSLVMAKGNMQMILQWVSGNKEAIFGRKGYYFCLSAVRDDSVRGA